MAGVDVYYNSSNKLTATLTKSSDGSAQTGATVTMSVYPKGSSGSLTLDGVSMTEGSSGQYEYTAASTVWDENARYVAELTAVVAATTSQRFAKVPVRVITDAD